MVRGGSQARSRANTQTGRCLIWRRRDRRTCMTVCNFTLRSVRNPSLVKKCIRLRGSKPAYYWIDKGRYEDQYIVIYPDRPNIVANMSKSEFQAAFIDYPPGNLPKIREIWASFPEFRNFQKTMPKENLECS